MMYVRSVDMERLEPERGPAMDGTNVKAETDERASRKERNDFIMVCHRM